MSNGFLYNKVVLREESLQAPAIATFNNNVYLAWAGVGNNHLNIIRSSDDGTTFRDKVTLREASENAPALAVFNNRLYLCWTGTDRRLNVMSSADGQTFENKVTLGETSQTGPSATVFFLGPNRVNNLFLAWVGVDNLKLNIIRSENGTNFSNKVTLNQTSPYTPAITAITKGQFGTLHLGWTGTDQEHHLNLISSQDGSTFGEVTVLGDRSAAGPSLLAGPVWTLWIAWIGVGNQQINFLDQSNGDKITLQDTSISTPSAIPGHLAWTGTDSSHSLNFARIRYWMRGEEPDRAVAEASDKPSGWD